MAESRVNIEPGVMDNLSPAERQSILDTVRHLQETDPAQWPKDQVTPLPHTKPWFLVRLLGELR